MSREILRFVDTIHRDRQIDKELIFKGLELALLSAAQKRFGVLDELSVEIDRETGEIAAEVEGEPVSPSELGRIAALSGKQVLYQKIREAERDVLYQEYLPKVGQLLTGTVQSKKPSGVMTIALGKAEGFLPRSEQSSAENFNEGDRIKVILKEVNMQPNRVQLLCSRGDADLVRRLFELEIPEVADFVVEIKGIAREAGHRTKIAVATYDANVDCVGACVGVKGARIRNIVDELFGEKIDIVRWNDSIEILIVEALRPAQIASLDLDFASKTAAVYVTPDQQSLAIGRRGQNVRLASKLTGWDLNITPVSEEDLDRMRAEGLENLAQGIFQDRLAQAEQEEAKQEAALSSSNPLDKLFVAAAGEAKAEETEEAKPDADPLARALEDGDVAEKTPGENKLDSAFAAAAGESAAETTAAETASEDSPEAGAEPVAEELDDEEAQDAIDLTEIPGVDVDLVERIQEHGFTHADEIVTAGAPALLAIEGITEDIAHAIVEFLKERSG